MVSRQTVIFIAFIGLLLSHSGCSSLIDDLKEKGGASYYHVLSDNSYEKFLGVVVRKSQDATEAGVQIVQVLKDSPAQQAGLIEGDFIVALDKITVSSSGELLRALRQSSNVKDSVKVSFRRPNSKRLQSLSVSLTTQEDYGNLVDKEMNLHSEFSHFPFIFANATVRADKDDIHDYLGYKLPAEDPMVYRQRTILLFFEYESLKVLADKFRFVIVCWPLRLTLGDDIDEDFQALEATFSREFIRL